MKHHFRQVAGVPEGVAVWAASLEVEEGTLHKLATWLSADEEARARKFRFARHRKYYAARRGLLRWLLASILAAAPEDIVFGRGPRGKPFIDAPDHGKRLRFNDSHSRELALFALAWDRDVGGDVEIVRTIPEADDIASRYFAPRETAEYEALPREWRRRAFFNAWTRKEAYLKATGEGISRNLAEVCVTIIPDEPAKLCHVAGAPGEAEMWELFHLEPSDGALGALCVKRAC